MKCGEKIRYLGQASAESAVRRTREFPRSKEEAKEMHRLKAYKCGECSFWHIGKDWLAVAV